MQLRDEFKSAIQSAIEQCYSLGYYPTRFEQMIEDRHPVEVAKKLALSGDLQYGLKELNRMGKLELTMESIMLQPKFKSLFSTGELEAAEWRLKNVGKG